jgi:nicotinate-nucleotide adenylyltransferase
MKKKRLGIFGGTFDPPHVGHLILAAEARDQLDLDCTIWVLTPDPPHKQGKEITSIDQRLAMVNLAIEGDGDFCLSTVDIDRPGPHYSLDTVRILREEFGDHELFYLMGGDSMQDLPNWYRAAEFLSLLDGIGVMRRPGDEIDLQDLFARLAELRQKINFITAPLLEISAEQIRQRAKEHRAFRYYVLPIIYEYITQHKLYEA